MSALARSTLYVPGDQPEKLAKALKSGADGIICDLEDAVAPSSKLAARSTVAEFIRTQMTGENRPALLVRVNVGSAGIDDLRGLVSVCGEGLAAVYLPKISHVDELHTVDVALTAMEEASGLVPRSLSIVALLETAEGIFNARSIASGPRVRRLAIGEADLSAELGVELTPGSEHEMLSARTMLVLASAAAGIDPPVGPVSTDFRDLDALRASCEVLRRMGFRGRSCIHPAQVAVVNEVFTPTLAQLAKAEYLVERYNASVAAGEGVTVDENGKMVDEAVVRTARRIAAQREAILLHRS